MSFKAAGEVWGLELSEDIDSGCLLVLMCLADAASNDNFDCWPRVKTLSKFCRMSERSVRYKLNTLEQNGLISKTRTRQPDGRLGTVKYTLEYMNERPAAESASGCQPAAKYDTTSGKIRPKPAAESAGHNLSLEPISKPIRGKRKKAPPAVLPDWLDPTAWDEYRSHRKDLKKPMSALAEKKAINELTRLKNEGSDFREVINNSIVNGWAGLFASKNKTKTTQKEDQEYLDNRLCFNTWDGILK